MGRRQSSGDEEESIGEMWKGYREAQQDRRAERLPIRTAEILALAEKGFAVEQLSDYQFRINGRLDLYPIHRRYHDLNTHKRGNYGTAFNVATKHLGAR